MADFGGDQPPVDLRRLVFPSEGITVDTLESDEFVFATDNWVLDGRSIDGRKVRNAAAVLNGVVGQGDVLKAPSAPTTVHRFLRGVTGGELAIEGNYLVHIGDHWISCSACSREPGKPFNTKSIDFLLLSLSLSDAPRAGEEVPRPWKQYQKTRKSGTPNGKFALYMDPSPVWLGSHHKYLEIVRSSRQEDMRFSLAEYQQGGRQLSPEILEFFAKDDRPSIRVDVWVGSEPGDKMDRQAVYGGELQVTSPAVELWSLGDPCTLVIEPGLYDVRVVLVNRGRCEAGRYLLHRERFEQDDRERYEITMNLKRAR
jgi:hypothetical protein